MSLVAIFKSECDLLVIGLARHVGHIQACKC